MKKRNFKLNLKDMLLKFLKLAFVVIVAVTAYFVMIYPVAKRAFVKRYVPILQNSPMMDTSYSGMAPRPTISVSESVDSKAIMMPPVGGNDGFVVDGQYDQKVIKNANLDIKVASVPNTLRDIQTMADQVGGFTQNAYTAESQVGVLTGSVTVRVPEANFTQSLDKIKSLATRVVSENISGQDVTQEFSDLKSQLDSLVRVKDQYSKLLEDAKTVEEILQVQDRLNNTQQQIDYIQGRINYTNNQTSYASIYVNMNEEVIVQLPVDKFDLGSTVKESISTAVRILQNSVTFIIVTIFTLLGLIPYFLIIWLLIWLGKKAYRKFKSVNKKK